MPKTASKNTKIISILGSTGSIGRQTLEVVSSSEDSLKVYALAASTNVKLMEEQIRSYRPKLAVMMNERAASELKERVKDLSVEIETGMEGLIRAASSEPVQTVVTAVSGRIGLEPTLEAIKSGKTIALANKETLVAAGDLVMETAKKMNCMILPVDSEHSAIFQCLQGSNPKNIEKIILTASGGPFFGKSKEELTKVTPELALKHPNWAMGSKITIDSATMMNKGLEVIEAHHLFGLSYDCIDVVIHPQSIIHSMVEYCDGSILAQLGRPDMRLPIQYALSYPARWKNPFERLDFKNMSLTFHEPDFEAFPALRLAFQAGKIGGTLPAVLNAANEVAVEAFLKNKLNFSEISQVVEQACKEHSVSDGYDLDTILDADAWARNRVGELLED